MMTRKYSINALLEMATLRAEHARQKFGEHPNVEFTCCRIAEEAGELIQAATSTSKNRNVDRGGRVVDEIMDLMAMLVRLAQAFPDERYYAEAIRNKPI